MSRTGFPTAARLAAGLLTLALATTSGRGQDARFGLTASGSDVRDPARLFGTEAVRKAKAEVERVERETQASILVETVASLGSESVRTAAAENARRWGRPGVYVLIDKADHKFEVVPSPGFEKAVNREDLQVFRDAFLTQFKKGQFDEGLANGVSAIGLALAAAAREGKVVRREAPEPRPVEGRFDRLAQGTHSESGVVVRGQTRLTLRGARSVVAGASARAAELGLRVNVAVVDDGGHLLSFDRMDGARPASAYTAITKATTAATYRAETGPTPKGAATPDVLLNLSLQNAAAASGGKITTLYGGVPVTADGQVIGGVGVGGGTGEQDAEIARAGVNRFLEELKESGTRPADTDRVNTPGERR